MEFIRLEMGFKLQKLLQTMTAADKNLTTASLFQKQFKASPKLDSQEVNSDFKSIYKNIKELRKDFIIHCKVEAIKDRCKFLLR